MSTPKQTAAGENLESGPETVPDRHGSVWPQVAHDIAGELTVLQGALRSTQRMMGEGRARPEHLQPAIELFVAINEMFRDTVRSVEGGAEVVAGSFDPVRLTKVILAQRSHVLKTVTLSLCHDVPEGLRVSRRGSFWIRTLANLLHNSLPYARCAIAVRVAVRYSDGAPTVLLMRVEDDGPGVPEDERSAVFLPFWRGKSGITGLGLSSATWAAEQLGGTLAYQADSQLGGAAFELAIPFSVCAIEAPPAPAPSRTRPLLGALADVAVCVVDDDPRIRFLAERLLQRVGANVPLVEPELMEREAVLTAIRDARPDVVVLDMNGPNCGAVLYDELAVAVPALADRVLFISGGWGANEQTRLAMGSGRPTLAEPFAIEGLVEAIEAVHADQSRGN